MVLAKELKKIVEKGYEVEKDSLIKELKYNELEIEELVLANASRGLRRAKVSFSITFRPSLNRSITDIICDHFSGYGYNIYECDIIDGREVNLGLEW